MHAECEMKVYEAIPPSRSLGIKSIRNDFYRACLTSEGFILRQVDNENEG